MHFASNIISAVKVFAVIVGSVPYVCMLVASLGPKQWAIQVTLQSLWYLFGSYAYTCGSGVSVEFIKALHGVIFPNSFLLSKLFPGSSKYFLFTRPPLSCPPARELVLFYPVPVLLQQSLPLWPSGKEDRAKSQWGFDTSWDQSTSDHRETFPSADVGHLSLCILMLNPGF